MKVGKYAFNTKEQALTKVRALGVDDNGKQTHDHVVVHLGNIPMDDNTLSDQWHVDVLWQHTYDEEGEVVEPTHPYGWATYAVNLEDEGWHQFSGYSYVDLKLA